ncbi:MAG: aldehyde dehydrogenase family protein [Actinophytocola sp.]|nr:aldehyde dehydrogenase family protein [Actinophytocola sp.]
MTSTTPAGTGQQATSGTIGGVAGAPSASRAQELVSRAAGGKDSAPVQMTAPFTGEPIASLPQATDADVRAAFDDARAAQRKWAVTPAVERQQVLTRLMKLVLDRQQEGLDLVQVESGKSRLDAFDEIAATALASSYYGKHSAKLLGQEHASAPQKRCGADAAVPQVRTRGAGARTRGERLRCPVALRASFGRWRWRRPRCACSRRAWPSPATGAR